MELYKIALEAADIGFEIASNYLNDAVIISSKEKDIKTFADIAVNEAILKVLKKSHIPIFSEEIAITQYHLPKLCWIIDPLDGTYNFSRGFPYTSISICLWNNEEPIIGVVKNIFNGLTYSTEAKRGIFSNGRQLKVSEVDTIKNATLATGFPSGTNYSTEHLLKVVSYIQKFKKVRAIGSASLMISNVASGVFDAYYEKDIYLWDVAAGLALIKEAGGKYFLRREPDSFKCEVLATNALIYDMALKELIH
jgi:fructose-1,6-bisphosphatase/inositol monophosphatase family enzyme